MAFLGLGKSAYRCVRGGKPRWAEKPVVNGVITPFKQGEISPVTPFIRPFIGGLTPSATSRGPHCSQLFGIHVTCVICLRR